MKRKITISESQIINAIKKVINEARRNPETNIDESFTDFYNRMIQKAPIKNIFISFRDTTHVTDVNPKNIYNTPTGFYTYPLVAFDIPDNPTEIEFRRKFPFANDKEYINFFMLKNHDGILTGGTDKTTLDEYVKKIKKLYNGVGEVEKLCDSFIDGSYSSDYKKSPVHDTHLFWFLLYDIAKDMQKKSKQNRINLICRKIGVNGFIDYEGHGFIHPAEPSQAVFFRVKNLGEVFIYEKPRIDNNTINNAIQNKEYKIARDVTDDIKVIYLFDKYGLINKNGEPMSKQLFDYIAFFKDGVASVELNNKWNAIDRNGKLISKRWYDSINEFGNGIAKVIFKGKSNFINQNGELQSKQWFDIIYGFKHGIAKVQIKDKYNLINQNGELLSPNKWFDWAGSFQDGFAAVNLGGKWNLFKQNGELLSPNQWFDNIGDFNKSGIARVDLKGKFNLINRGGDILSPKQWFDDVIGFTNSEAKVELQGEIYKLDFNDGSIVEVN